MARRPAPPQPPMKVVNIDKYLGKAKDRVALIGVELEGGWTKLPEGCRLTHDGSVRLPPPTFTGEDMRRYTELSELYRRGRIIDPQVVEYRELHRRLENGGMSTGELPSPPLNIEDLSPWMKVHYPQHVNGTCGMHMHMSFKHALHYDRLMVPDFTATVLEYIKRWSKNEALPPEHPIWDRLSGKSVYCQHKFYAMLQAQRKGEKGHDQHSPGHRYTVINYPFGRFQTVECRLLPMMDKVDQSIRAIQEVVSITNAFLLTQSKKEPLEVAHISIDDDPIREEVLEYLN